MDKEKSHVFIENQDETMKENKTKVQSDSPIIKLPKICDIKNETITSNQVKTVCEVRDYKTLDETLQEHIKSPINPSNKYRLLKTNSTDINLKFHKIQDIQSLSVKQQ